MLIAIMLMPPAKRVQLLSNPYLYIRLCVCYSNVKIYHFGLMDKNGGQNR
jgi:hypothetical protein